MRKSLLENALLLAVVAAICGGSVPVVAKIALEVFHPFTLVFIRFFFASLVLLPFILYTVEFNLATFKRFFPVALVGAINPILLFIALPSTQASVSPLIYAGVPAMTALYLYIVVRERISKRQLLGILLGLVGVSIIVLLPLISSALTPAAFVGNVLIFIAAIAFTAYGIMSKKSQATSDASPIELVFYFCVVAMLASIPFALREMYHDDLLQAVETRHLLAAIFSGVVGTGIFYLSYQYALRAGSEVSAALFTYLQPIATILLAYLFLSEQLTLPFFIGGVLAVAGAQLASRK